MDLRISVMTQRVGEWPQRFGLLFALLGSTACGTLRYGETQPTTMDSATILRCALDPAARAFDVESLGEAGGSFMLAMIADSTPGVVVEGALTLEPGPPGGDSDTGLAGPPPRLVGSSDIDPAALGAMVPGDASSTDSAAPGAALYTFEGADGPTAVIRLGAESNRRDRQRFDGAHTTLTIRSAADGSFGGSWESAEAADVVTGTFCAAPRDLP